MTTITGGAYRHVIVLDWPAELGTYPRRDMSPTAADALVDAYVSRIVARLGPVHADVLGIGAPIPGRRADLSPCITVCVYGDVSLAPHGAAFAARLRKIGVS